MTASCPSGYKLTGGGVYSYPNNISEDAPYGGNGWQGSAFGGSLTVYAVCWK